MSLDRPVHLVIVSDNYWECTPLCQQCDAELGRPAISEYRALDVRPTKKQTDAFKALDQAVPSP